MYLGSGYNLVCLGCYIVRVCECVFSNNIQMMGIPIIWERRLLFGSTGGTLFGVLLHIIALATPNWLTFEIPGGVYSNKTGHFLSEVQSGLWISCKTFYVVSTTDSGQVIRTFGKCTYVIHG